MKSVHTLLLYDSQTQIIANINPFALRVKAWDRSYKNSVNWVMSIITTYIIKRNMYLNIINYIKFNWNFVVQYFLIITYLQPPPLFMYLDNILFKVYIKVVNKNFNKLLSQTYLYLNVRAHVNEARFVLSFLYKMCYMWRYNFSSVHINDEYLHFQGSRTTYFIKLNFK